MPSTDKPFRFNAADAARALDAYEALGFCIVSGLVTPVDCERMHAIYADYQARAGRGQGNECWLADDTAWDRSADAAPILRKVGKPFQTEAAFRDIFARSALLDVVELFVGPDIYLHSSKMIYKSAATGRPKPMHQDLAYWETMTARQVTLWCPADPARADNGCLELWPGLHRAGLIEHQQIEDWQIPPGRLTAEPMVVEMDPGEALFLHPLTPHASRPNVSQSGRLAAVINYYSEPKRADGTEKYGSYRPIRTRC